MKEDINYLLISNKHNNRLISKDYLNFSFFIITVEIYEYFIKTFSNISYWYEIT